MSRPVIELESIALATTGRDTFQGKFKGRMFQVYCLPEDLLFLDLGSYRTFKHGDTDNRRGLLAIGMMFGMLGCALAQAINRAVSGKTRPARLNDHTCHSDDELRQLVRQRKKSFIIPNDELKRAWLAAPSGFAGKNCFGRLRIKAKKQPRNVELELIRLTDMEIALDALPQRFGDRLKLNAKYSPRRQRFVAAR